MLQRPGANRPPKIARRQLRALWRDLFKDSSDASLEFRKAYRLHGNTFCLAPKKPREPSMNDRCPRSTTEPLTFPARRREFHLGRRALAVAMVGGLALGGSLFGLHSLAGKKDQVPIEYSFTDPSLMRQALGDLSVLAKLGLCADKLSLQSQLDKHFQDTVGAGKMPRSYVDRFKLFASAAELAKSNQVGCSPTADPDTYTELAGYRVTAMDITRVTIGQAWCNQRSTDGYAIRSYDPARPDQLALYNYYSDELALGDALNIAYNFDPARRC